MFEKSLEILKKADLQIYVANDDTDSLLVRWWIALKKSGEIQNTLATPPYDLYSFLGLFQLPSILIYAIKEANLDFATWLAPYERGLMYGCWSSYASRGTDHNIKRMLATLEFALSLKPVVICTTKQPIVAKTLHYAGFVVVPTIPGLLDDDSTMLYVTQALYNESLVIKGGY